jgi:acyl-coenzyme A thioesterase PaaI-like protein
MNADELVLPTGSTLDPAMVFAVASRTNAAQAALGTQLLDVGARTATIRVPWRADLGAGGATARWADFVVAMLVDHACSLAAHMALDDPARWAGSLDLRVDHCRPLDASPFLVSRAVCDERIGTVMRVRAVVSADADADGDDPMAVGLCTIAVVDGPTGGLRP